MKNLFLLILFSLVVALPALAQDETSVLRTKAEQGDKEAQFNLGVMYDDGEGVSKDSVEAVKWYRKAAEQGLAEAQYNLGQAYYYGDGVPKDLVQAHMWYNLSGAKGTEEAKLKLETLEKQMSAEQKAEAMKLARDRGAKANP